MPYTVTQTASSAQATLGDFSRTRPNLLTDALDRAGDRYGLVFYHHDLATPSRIWRAHVDADVAGGELVVQVDSGVRHYEEDDSTVTVGLRFRRKPGHGPAALAPEKSVPADSVDFEKRIVEAVGQALDTDPRRCSECDHLLAVRTAGAVDTPFYGCLNFPNCGHTAATHDHPSCPDCGGAMVVRERRRDSHQFWGCLNYPNCKRTIDRPE